MFSSIVKAFTVKELRDRVMFTLFCIIIFKFLLLIPTPGVDAQVGKLYFSDLTGKIGDIFKMVNAFSGGAFSGMTLLALSISPYVSATIFVQIYSSLNADTQRELAQSPGIARRKIGIRNKYVALLLAVVQATLFAKYALHINKFFPGLIAKFLVSNKILFYPVFVTSMASGTMVLVWLSDIMTEKGIGNGVSVIVSVGILSSSYKIILKTIWTLFSYLFLGGSISGSFVMKTTLFSALFLFVLVWSIMLSLGQKEIPVIYAKRISGNRMIQGRGAPFIPLRVNYSGIIPIIFSSSILMFLSSFAGLLGQYYGSSTLINIFSPTSVPYIICYSLLIFLFSYFWTSVQFKPKNISSDLKKSGAFIPGVKQGAQTEKMLNYEMHKTNMIGTLMLCVLAIIPWILERIFMIDRSSSYLVGGTTILLLTGTIVDVFSQISGYMIHYKQASFSVRR